MMKSRGHNKLYVTLLGVSKYCNYISLSKANLGFKPNFSLEHGIKAYTPEIKRVYGSEDKWLAC